MNNLGVSGHQLYQTHTAIIEQQCQTNNNMLLSPARRRIDSDDKADVTFRPSSALIFSYIIECSDTPSSRKTSQSSFVGTGSRASTNLTCKWTIQVCMQGFNKISKAAITGLEDTRPLRSRSPICRSLYDFVLALPGGLRRVAGSSQ